MTGADQIAVESPRWTRMPRPDGPRLSKNSAACLATRRGLNQNGDIGRDRAAFLDEHRSCGTLDTGKASPNALDGVLVRSIEREATPDD